MTNGCSEFSKQVVRQFRAPAFGAVAIDRIPQNPFRPDYGTHRVRISEVRSRHFDVPDDPFCRKGVSSVTPGTRVMALGLTSVVFRSATKRDFCGAKGDTHSNESRKSSAIERPCRATSLTR